MHFFAFNIVPYIKSDPTPPVIFSAIYDNILIPGNRYRFWIRDCPYFLECNYININIFLGKTGDKSNKFIKFTLQTLNV